jgi:DeoR/GlpR family transcriptional regulator of sugar metabolism
VGSIKATGGRVRTRELAARRLERLGEIVRDHRVVRVDEVCERLRVSPATARRDLEALERRGDLRRVHGGAVSMGSRVEEPAFEDKASIAPREKRRIALAALEFVKPGDTVFLDGGSTVLELARLLRDRTGITVVTNSLRSAQELAGGGPRLILIGGELRRLSQTLVGPLTRLVLAELHVDKAFLGTMGLALQEGLTTSDPGEAYTKMLVTEQAREVILLADSTKVGKVSFAKAGRLERVRVLVTDRKVDPAFARELARRGVRVVRV